MPTRKRRIPDLSLQQVRIGEVVRHLRQVQSAVIVAAAALRSQNCELDADVANVLQRSVSDRLHEQLRRLDEIISSLPAGARGPRAGRRDRY